MRRRLALAFLAALAAASGRMPAHAGPLDDCRALLPNDVAPAYVAAPPHHTELCHAPAYVLSHDDQAHEPRWVAWLVTAEHLKMPHQARSNDFRADPDLPAGAAAHPGDYQRSGYDQGHMSDAEDNSWSPASEHLSFLLSNMIPQCPPCNRQTWRYVENWTRGQAVKRGQVYVIAGPVLAPNAAAIGADHVLVPSASWKLVLDVAGGAAWGFIVPNQVQALQPGADIAPYLVTPRAVETAAGLALPLPAGVDRDRSGPLD